MRVARRNVGLAIALGGLVAVLIALEGGGESERTIGRLFPEVSLSNARRIVLTDPEGTAPDDRLEIARDAGGAWILPQHFDHPARVETVQALFSGLTSLTNLDLLADEPASHDRYGVGDGGLRILVLGEGDARLAALVQGASADSAGRSSYVRPMDSDEVYRAPYLARQALEATTWIDTQFLDIEPVAVQAVSLDGTDAGEPLRVERDGVDRWKSGTGAAVPTLVVTELLVRSVALFFDEVVGRDAATTDIGDPALAITFELEDGREVRAVFGLPGADGTRLARRSDSEWVVRFGSGAYDLVLETVRALAPEDH